MQFPLIELFGRVHPMVLHLPIGLVAALGALEGLAILRGRTISNETRSWLVWMTAVAAVVSALSGLALSREDGYTREGVQLHQWLGIAFAGAAIACAVVSTTSLRKAGYPLLLAAMIGLIVPTGHLGASLTHGEGFLFEPLHARRSEQLERSAAPAQVKTEFEAVIEPVFAQRCYSCHGERKQKGGLALNSREAIMRGGEDGPVIIASDVRRSDLVHRISLPADDKNRMPPKGKPGLTPEQIGAIEAWVAAGASFDTPARSVTAESPSAPATGAGPIAADEKAPPSPPPADPGAIEALKAAHAHVAPIEPGSRLLHVDLSGVSPDATDETIAALLAPLAPHVAELDLGRRRIGERSMAVMASMRELTSLDLAATGVTDALLAALGGRVPVESLVLTQCALTDAATASLEAMTELKRVYLWKSGVSVDAAAALSKARPELLIDLGDSLADAGKPLETEPEIALSSDRPLPGVVSAVAVELKPSNTVCPVSGKPVDPRYVVLHKGKLIGFCCEKCGAAFWSEPEKFEAAIK